MIPRLLILIFAIAAAIAGTRVCAQPVPTNNPIRVPDPNVFQQGNVTLVAQPNGGTNVEVNEDGIVGYIMPAGQTNPVIVTADSHWTRTGLTATEITPEGDRRFYLWIPVQTSADLLNWQPMLMESVYCIPSATPQIFFRPPRSADCPNPQQPSTINLQPATKP